MRCKSRKIKAKIRNGNEKGKGEPKGRKEITVRKANSARLNTRLTRVRKGRPKVKRKTMGEDKETQTRPSTMADQVGVHEAPTTKQRPETE
jgi:hypothetical protein